MLITGYADYLQIDVSYFVCLCCPWYVIKISLLHTLSSSHDLVGVFPATTDDIKASVREGAVKGFSLDLLHCIFLGKSDFETLF